MNLTNFDKKTVENAIYVFTESYPDRDISTLTLTLKTEDYSIFDSPYGMILMFDDGDQWSDVPKFQLSPNCTQNEFGVTLTQRMDADISYELYPFEQCASITPAEAGYHDLTPVEPIALGSDKGKYQDDRVFTYPWVDNLSVRICYDECTYAVLRDGVVISEFEDPETHFQQGDGDTQASIAATGQFIIEQYGDVSSMVVISNGAALPYEP